MADRISRGNRWAARKVRQAETYERNKPKKRDEQARRATRMKELIQKGTYPYTPAVASWVSTQIGKPFTQISEAEVKELVK
jgi:hypothetical protein